MPNSPAPYFAGAKKCGVEASACESSKGPRASNVADVLIGLVVEDAPNGIRSGKAAGAKVLAVLTSHSREAVEAAKPDWIIPDLTQYGAFVIWGWSLTLGSISFAVKDGIVELTINESA